MHKILIVDDIGMNRILIRSNLEDLPEAIFLEATNGREALDVLADQEIDLVLLDLQMPVMDGFAVLEAMRGDERLQNIPVVVQSLLDDEISVHRALALGAYDYFPRSPDGDVFRRDLAMKSRNAIASFAAFKAASQELAERKLAEQRLAVSRRRRQLSEMFSGMLVGRITQSQFFRQLKLFCVEPEFPQRVFLIAIESSGGHGKKELQERPIEWQSLEDALLDLLEGTGIHHAWPYGDYIVLLGRAEDPLMVMEEWKKRIESSLPQLTTVMAASGLCREAGEVPQRHQEACDALRSARCDPSRGGIATYEDIGVDRLLIPIADRSESEEYIKTVLQPLIDYDRKQRNSDLTQTLEVLLTTSDNKEAAKSLDIHMKTLLYRRKRIQEILHVNLAAADRQLSLATALRLRRLRG